MTDDEKLQLDYDTTVRLVLALTDVRFKLLALVPTIAAAAVAIASRSATPAELVAVGLLGFVATAGILVYELRNSQFYDAAVHRAKVLEHRLGLSSAIVDGWPGGVFSERPNRVTAFHAFKPKHDLGLALVYAAALGGWAYLIGWGVAARIHATHPKGWGIGFGLLVAFIVIWGVHEFDDRGKKQGTPRKEHDTFESLEDFDASVGSAPKRAGT
jgi:hypothetical protein